MSFVLLESDFVDTFVGGVCQFCENERFGQCTAMGIAVEGDCLGLKVRCFCGRGGVAWVGNQIFFSGGFPFFGEELV